MKIALTALFAATVAASSASAWAQDPAPRPVESIPAGVPLRVELDRSYPLRVNTRVEGHLTEPVYLVDHVVIPQDSKVFGTILSKHSVNRQTRTAAMLNGDMTPLKVADLAFTQLETPDGRHFAIDTDVTERTTSIVRMANVEVKQHHSLGRRIAAAFRWTRTAAVAEWTAPHREDRLRHLLYKEVPLHPQEIWAGTEYDAELNQPLEITGEEIPAPAPVADLSEMELSGTIEARLVSGVDSSTAQAGMQVEAVLTQPLFAADSAVEARPDVPAAENSTGGQVRPIALTSSHLLATHSRRKLLLPEGTHLIGTVLQAKGAGMLGRNGTLRLSFRKVELPRGDVRSIHGELTEAESVQGDHVQIDSEGGAAAKSSNRFLVPLSLGVLAVAGNNLETGLVDDALSTNGMSALTSILGSALSQGGLVTGFTYYQVGKVVFDQFLGRGHDVVFAKNTRVEIELTQRQIIPPPTAEEETASQDGGLNIPRSGVRAPGTLHLEMIASGIR